MEAEELFGKHGSEGYIYISGLYLHPGKLRRSAKQEAFVAVLIKVDVLTQFSLVKPRLLQEEGWQICTRSHEQNKHLHLKLEPLNFRI